MKDIGLDTGSDVLLNLVQEFLVKINILLLYYKFKNKY
jgi:hypothetical protein